jgi:ubiquinone/menaquinone biosynthesis C-methylase UbiE
MLRTLPAVVLLLFTPMAHGRRHSPDEHGHSAHGQHGNPDDLDAYIAKMEAPDRAEWQKPDEVLKALALKPGQTACDLGTGPAWFALKLARAVGDRGHVFAVDVEPRILDVARQRIQAAHARNVTPVLGLPDDPLLPPESCDLVLIVDTFHHFPDGTAYLKNAARLLKPGGRLANIDFQKRETPVGPPVDHRVARETFLAQARAAGFELVAEPTFLPYQYFLILAPATRK